MSKLLERLRDPARSGVYRVTRIDEVLDAVQGSELDVVRIDLGRPVFEAFAHALSFPAWFGGNWDALEDCLVDLSWRVGAGHVLILEGGAASAMLIDVLGAAAQFWRGEGRPFFAVVVDGAKLSRLPDLFREK